MERRHFAVLLRRESLEPSFARMHDENFAACITHGLDKVCEKFPAVQVIDANAALDRNWNRNSVLHRLEAIGNDVLLFHEACAEVSVLHTVRWATAIQVDFAKACGFHKFRCGGKICWIAAAEL